MRALLFCTGDVIWSQPAGGGRDALTSYLTFGLWVWRVSRRHPVRRHVFSSSVVYSHHVKMKTDWLAWTMRHEHQHIIPTFHFDKTSIWIRHVWSAFGGDEMVGLRVVGWSSIRTPNVVPATTRLIPPPQTRFFLSWVQHFTMSLPVSCDAHVHLVHRGSRGDNSHSTCEVAAQISITNHLSVR